MLLYRYIFFVISLIALSGYAEELSFTACEGSLTPYPHREAAPAIYPDSLLPVFISHVGRHGSRYPASDTHCISLRKALSRARKLGTITPLGLRLDSVNEEIIRLSSGRWGALDSLGVYEQEGIGWRMYRRFPEIFTDDATVRASSSFSPRSIHSMDAFLSGLCKDNPKIRCLTDAGRQYNELVRPFDVNEAYKQYMSSKVWQSPYSDYFDNTASVNPIRRVLGEDFPFADEAEARELSLIEYYVLAGCSAMGLPNVMATFFTPTEAVALWSCFNLRQYLQRSASLLSTVPAEIALPLANNIIASIDSYIENPTQSPRAVLRFGHGETILPLTALLQFPGCYYMTADYQTVALHWHDFLIIPMAANVQFVLFCASSSQRYYMQVLLNEEPMQLIPGSNSSIYAWDVLKAHLTRFL